jgi:hypothetical protein
MIDEGYIPSIQRKISVRGSMRKVDNLSLIFFYFMFQHSLGFSRHPTIYIYTHTHQRRDEAYDWQSGIMRLVKAGVVMSTHVTVDRKVERDPEVPPLRRTAQSV